MKKKTRWNLKFILLNEGNSSEKAIYCLIPIISHSRKKQNYKARKNINACQELGGMNKEKTEFLGE